MKNKKYYLGITILLCLSVLAGCSKEGKENNPPGFQKVPVTENNDNNKKNSSGQKKGNSNDGSISNDADTLIDNSTVQGFVVDFSKTDCILSPLTSEEVDGGSLAVGAAPGYENEKDNININYRDGCQFQFAKINIASRNITFSDADISNVKKLSSLIIYGKWNDEHNIKASKIFIVSYE